MCLSVVAKIVEILDQSHALVDVGGVRKKITTTLIEGEKNTGDWLLLHAGFAIARVDDDKAKEILEAYKKIGGVPGHS